jgi:multiple sugar transport system ATP-binding protein
VYERPANLFVAGFLGAPSMNFIDGRLDREGRFTSPALSLDLDAAVSECEVVLGIRPEHIQIADAAPFEGSVSLVEPMGNHQIVWIAAGERTLSAIVNDTRAFTLGAPIRFAVDASRVSLFDKASELRLAAS